MINTLPVQQLQTFNTGIDLFCISELLIILFYIRKNNLASQEYTLFRYVILFTILALIGDAVSWLVNGCPGSWIPPLVYISNLLYMTSQLIAAMFTFGFFYWITYGIEPSKKLRWCILYIPFILVCICSYATPWTGLVFTVDASNFYHRGVLLPYFSLMTLAYIIAGSLICAAQIQKEALQNRKRRLSVLACYCIPAVIGSLFQTCFYGISLVLPCSSVALLMIFINEQDLKISVDSLTGLNNRGCFDRYLHNQLEMENRDDVGLIMIDVNDFKSINDQLGHIAGDDALKAVAEILRNSATNKDVFLARYGGDEFAYILHASPMAVEMIMDTIQLELAAYNEHSGQPFQIQLAMGFASYAKGTADTAESLIHKADEMMYANKRDSKQQPKDTPVIRKINTFWGQNKKK